MADWNIFQPTDASKPIHQILSGIQRGGFYVTNDNDEDRSRQALLDALAAAGYPAPSPSDPVYVHRTDTGNLERNTGNGFEIVDQWQRPDGVLNGATGTVRMEPGSPNEVVSIAIVFPEGLFSEAPALMSSIATTVPQQFPAQLGYSAIDEVSVTIYMLRTTSSAYTLRWGALGP